MKKEWILGICIVIIGFLFLTYGEKKGYWDKKGFKTDTITKKVFVYDTGGKGTQIIPPKIVYQYKTLTLPVNHYYTQFVHDTLTLHDTLSGQIHVLLPCYINNYLQIPKLVGARITKNGISLDLWDTLCSIQTKVWETNYDDYDYYWDGNNLKVSNTHISTIPKIGAFWDKFHTESNVYLTQELVTQSPTLGIDYSVNYGKVGLYGLGSIGYSVLNTQMQSRINIGVRIKLK